MVKSNIASVHHRTILADIKHTHARTHEHTHIVIFLVRDDLATHFNAGYCVFVSKAHYNYSLLIILIKYL